MPMATQTEGSMRQAPFNVPLQLLYALLLSGSDVRLGGYPATTALGMAEFQQVRKHIPGR